MCPYDHLAVQNLRFWNSASMLLLVIHDTLPREHGHSCILLLVTRTTALPLIIYPPWHEATLALVSVRLVWDPALRSELEVKHCLPQYPGELGYPVSKTFTKEGLMGNCARLDMSTEGTLFQIVAENSAGFVAQSNMRWVDRMPNFHIHLFFFFAE